MDIKMDPYRLLSDELTYELMIRGILTARTVAEKRTKLRDCLRAEQGEDPSAGFPLDPQAEHKICNQKLTELAQVIELFDDSKYQNEYARIGTRLTHLHKRLGRITDPRYKVRTAELTKNCEECFAQLRRKFIAQASAHLLAEQEVSKTEEDQPDPTTGSESESTVTVTPAETLESRLAAALERISLTVAESVQRAPGDKSTFPVHKWAVKYDGEAGLSNFLERIDELSTSRGISKPKLFASAVELFTGNALTWFRAKRHTLNTWEELTTALKETFLPSDYEFGLWDEIRNRTQGPEEKVSIFIANMEGLFKRLRTRPPEEERILYIRRNLLPYLQHRLGWQSIHTVNELDRLCGQLEDIQTRTLRLKAPPSARYSLEPDLAYQSPRCSQRVAAMDTDYDVVDAEPIAAPSRGHLTCWNCGNHGHRSAECRQPRNRHCYRCGKPEVTVKTCPVCNKSGNAARRH